MEIIITNYNSTRQIAPVLNISNNTSGALNHVAKGHSVLEISGEVLGDPKVFLDMVNKYGGRLFVNTTNKFNALTLDEVKLILNELHDIQELLQSENIHTYKHENPLVSHVLGCLIDIKNGINNRNRT